MSPDRVSREDRDRLEDEELLVRELGESAPAMNMNPARVEAQAALPAAGVR